MQNSAHPMQLILSHDQTLENILTVIKNISIKENLAKDTALGTTASDLCKFK